MKRFFLCVCIIVLSSSNSSLCSIKSLITKMTSFLKQVKSKATSFLKQAKIDLERVDIGKQSLAKQYIEQNKTLMQNLESKKNWKQNWKTNTENYGKSLLTSYNIWQTTNTEK